MDISLSDQGPEEIRSSYLLAKQRQKAINNVPVCDDCGRPAPGPATENKSSVEDGNCNGCGQKLYPGEPARQ